MIKLIGSILHKVIIFVAFCFVMSNAGAQSASRKDDRESPFIASDFETIYSSLLDLKSAISQKDPYETEKEFAGRANASASSLAQFGIARIAIDSAALKSLDYNADRKVLRIQTDNMKNTLAIWKDDNVFADPYRTYNVAVNCKKCVRELSILIDRDMARSVTEVRDGNMRLDSRTAGIAVVGKVIPPYVSTRVSYGSGIEFHSYYVHLSDPKLVLYNRNTGSVYGEQ